MSQRPFLGPPRGRPRVKPWTRVCRCYPRREDYARELLRTLVCQEQLRAADQRRVTPIEIEHIAGEFGLPGLLSAGSPPGPGRYVVQDLAGLQRDLGRMAKCPRHGGRVSLIPRLGRFWIVGNPGSYRVERDTVGTFDVMQTAQREAVQARARLKGDPNAPEEFRDTDCEDNGGLAISAEEHSHDHIRRGEHIPQQASVWVGCRLPGCPICETRDALPRFFRLMNAASYQLLIAPRAGQHQAARVTGKEMQEACREAHTTWAREAVLDGSGDWWVVKVAPPGTFGDPVTHPLDLWRRVYEPASVRAYTAGGDGWEAFDTSNTLVATLTVGTDPATIAYDNATQLVYVADYGSADVYSITNSGGAGDIVAGATPVGTHPIALASAAAAASGWLVVYVADFGSSDVRGL